MQPGRQERHAARLAAVQAIYQMELTGGDADTVTREFLEHRFADLEIAGKGPDGQFFGDLVRGVPHHQTEIDRAIAGDLSEGWKLQRIDSILRAILRAGTYELIARKDVPAKVVIDEYVGISHDFLADQDAAFVNALLDRVAHRKRALEFGEHPPDDEIHF
ncbi:MAG: transcription antitermination factor NusB [Alphaproteobacteria bacterium]|nr:transcription antitermination factor NusB [Alphaproteobacteria bacterium]MBV9061866.1 transcription antitermination factor NusB [Alphaproteobacteria bacterium]